MPLTTNPATATGIKTAGTVHPAGSPLPAPEPPASASTGMAGIVSAQPSPGARTCIVVGDLDQVQGLDLSSYSHVLWFRVSEAAGLPEQIRPASLPVKTVTLGRPDSLPAAQTVSELIELDKSRLPSVYLTTDAIGAAANACLPIVEAIFAQFEAHAQARVFFEQVSFLFQKNILANLRAYLGRRIPDCWANALAGMPALVCGAGPSLDAALAPLAHFARQAVVFAADSALPALARGGIPVDFAVSIDARKTPEKCLPPGAPLPDRMILASAALPEWRERLPADRTYFISGAQKTELALAQLGAPQTGPRVANNCGITAFELALYLGCSPICLFGMDHAVDSASVPRLHCDAIAQEDIKHQSGKNYFKVPGNYRAEVATHVYRDWHYFDHRCAGLPPGLVHNVTDRGARLRNTRLIHPADWALPAAGADKASRLELLAPARALTGPEAAKLQRHLAGLAQNAAARIAQARHELAHGQSEKAFLAYSALFQDNHPHPLWGNYTGRVAPYLDLARPISPSLWLRLLEEAQTLCARLTQPDWE